jgi:cytochrome c5
MPVLATDSEESGPPQRKLAPEAPILTTKVEIPVETASAATPVTQDNSAILDREAYIEYVNQYNRARRTQLEAEEEASRRLVERACGACHVPTLIGNSHWDTPVEYFDFVTRKVASGAQLTREEVPAVADYLFRMYGNQQQPEQSKTDVGKTVFDAACTQCHAADVMKNHAYAEPGRYRDIVADMIGKGATVPEPQINPLVDYLLRTYGVKGRP